MAGEICTQLWELAKAESGAMKPDLAKLEEFLKAIPPPIPQDDLGRYVTELHEATTALMKECQRLRQDKKRMDEWQLFNQQAIDEATDEGK